MKKQIRSIEQLEKTARIETIVLNSILIGAVIIALIIAVILIVR